MLYNIHLLINQYSSSIAMNLIAKTMNNIKIFPLLFHQIFRSLHQPLVLHQIFPDISNPHEYPDIFY